MQNTGLSPETGLGVVRCLGSRKMLMNAVLQHLRYLGGRHKSQFLADSGQSGIVSLAVFVSLQKNSKYCFVVFRLLQKQQQLFFQGNHSKRRGRKQQKSGFFSYWKKAISAQAWRTVSWALQALSLIMLFESLCNSPSSPPAGSRDPICPTLPPYHPIPQTHHACC